jgi:hypothetical protein
VWCIPAFVFCIAVSKREFETIGAEVGDVENLCSVACYHYCNADSLTAKVVKTDYVLLTRNSRKRKEESFMLRSTSESLVPAMICPRHDGVQYFAKKRLHYVRPWKLCGMRSLHDNVYALSATT